MKLPVVISPKNKLISEDWISAFNGLKKMVVGTTTLFLVTLLGKYLDDPMGLLKADWRALGMSYATIELGTVVTFIYNLLLKYRHDNEYIKNE